MLLYLAREASHEENHSAERHAKTAAGVGAVAATVALGMLVKRQRVRATCKPFYSGATAASRSPD